MTETHKSPGASRSPVHVRAEDAARLEVRESFKNLPPVPFQLCVPRRCVSERTAICKIGDPTSACAHLCGLQRPPGAAVLINEFALGIATTHQVAQTPLKGVTAPLLSSA